MKLKRVNKKLKLNKLTIAYLNRADMNNVFGGADDENESTNCTLLCTTTCTVFPNCPSVTCPTYITCTIGDCCESETCPTNCTC
jgi:natural product precursor